MNELFEDDQNMNIIENNNHINNNIIINIIDGKIPIQNRYVNIINNMGLNISINYPFQILIAGIVQLHTKIVNQYKYVFRDNILSQNIKNNLFDKSGDYTTYTYAQIRRALLYAYKYYQSDLKYNNKEKSDNVDKCTLGFNFQHPRWVPLYSLEIE